MLDIERLKPEEFPLLQTFADGYTPDPNKSIVVVARNDKGIVGRIFLLAPAHVEGVFIQKAWRNGPLLKRMVDAVELEAKAEGIRDLIAYADGPEMEDYINRLGYMKLPVSVWSKQLCP